MKRGLVRLAVQLFVASELCFGSEPGFLSMFNGKDLTGWSGKPGSWRVEHGAIVGESAPERPCKKTHYLYWCGGEPADFILGVKIKLLAGNSGIQFRSARRPDFDTFG